MVYMGKTILQIGSGMGTVGGVSLAILRKDEKLIVLDPNIKELEKHRKGCERSNAIEEAGIYHKRPENKIFLTGIEYVVAFRENLPFADGVIDEMNVVNSLGGKTKEEIRVIKNADERNINLWQISMRQM